MPQPMTELQSAIDESKQPLPFSAGGQGVTATQSLSHQPMPKTIADFNARGGISNTFQETYNNIISQKRQRAIQKGFEKILQGGEAAADAAYNDYVRVYGEEIKDWIPPKDLFYDDKTGAFLPYKYYESLVVGKNKYLDHKRKQDETKKAEEANKSFAPVLNEPDISQSEAYSKALEQGTVTPEMRSGISTLNNPNKKDKTKDDLAWAKLAVQKGNQRLAEMRILLTQEQNRSESNRKAAEKIADAQKDLREAKARQKELQTMYNRSVSGSPVIDKDGNMLDAGDLSEMIRNADVTVNEIQQNINELESLRKSRALSPITEKVREKAGQSIGADMTPAPSAPVPKPMSNPGYQAPTRKPLDSFMR
jgi:hypothetical protein